MWDCLLDMMAFCHLKPHQIRKIVFSQIGGFLTNIFSALELKGNAYQERAVG